MNRVLPRPLVQHRPVRIRQYRTHASWQEVIIDQSYFIGKGLTLFVLFTSTLNWLHYRKLREKSENEKNKKD